MRALRSASTNLRTSNCSAATTTTTSPDLIKHLRIAFSTSARRYEVFETGFNSQKSSRIEESKSRDGRRLTPQQQRRNETWQKFMETANLNVIKGKKTLDTTVKLPSKWAVRSSESSAISNTARDEFLVALEAVSNQVVLPNPLYSKDLLFGHERPRPVRVSKKMEEEEERKIEEDKPTLKVVHFSKEYEESIAKALVLAKAKAEAEAEAEALRKEKKLQKPEIRLPKYPLVEDVGLLGLARYSKIPRDISKLVNELFPVIEPPPERTPRPLPWLDAEIMDELEAMEIKQRAHDQLRTPLLLINPHVISTTFKASIGKPLNQPQLQSLNESEEEVLTLVNVGTTLLPSDIRRAVDVSSDYVMSLKNTLNSIAEVTVPRDRKLNPLPFYNVSFKSKEDRKAWQDRFLAIYNQYDDADEDDDGELAFNGDGGVNIGNSPLSSMEKRYESTIPLERSSLYLPEARNWQHFKHSMGNRDVVNYFGRNQGDGGPNRVVKMSMAKLFWRDFRDFLFKFILEQGGYSRSLLDGDHAVQRWRHGEGATKSGAGEELIWLVKFKVGFEHEAQRLVRDWDMKWVRMETPGGQEHWTRLEAEVMW